MLISAKYLTHSLYSDYLSCDLLILHELLRLRLCSGLITLKISFKVGDDNVWVSIPVDMFSIPLQGIWLLLLFFSLGVLVGGFFQYCFEYF